MRLRPPHSLRLISAVLPLLLPLVSANQAEDDARLGQYYTTIPIYRSGSGTNVVSVGLGSPAQNVNLTLTTNAEFILVADTSCDECTSNADEFDSTKSNTITISQQALSYSTIFPFGALDNLRLTGTFATDKLADPRSDGYPRVMGLIKKVEEATALSPVATTQGTLPDGVGGFFGLGVYQPHKDWSILPSVMETNTAGAPAGLTSYIVGLNIDKFSRDTSVQVGQMHWGGVPAGNYVGNFKWLGVNTSVGAGWGFQVQRMRVGDAVVDAQAYYGSIDPGFDAIFVPTAIAEKLHSSISGATRDVRDRTRWNIPCDLKPSMTIAIANREYNVDSSQIVQPKDNTGRACWSAIAAWQNGSLPELNGEIRLGTPFLSGVYTAIYYSDTEQYVGIAGKPGSVNDLNVAQAPPPKPNTRLAGILIGSLLAALIVLLIGCYARNRNSFQSMWYRAVRREHRMQVNAMVRAATIPPPMFVGGPVVPPMMPVPMNGGVMPMTMPPVQPGPMMGRMGYMPVATGVGMGPQTYAGGMWPQQQQQQQQQQHQHGQQLQQQQQQHHAAPPYQPPMTLNPAPPHPSSSRAQALSASPPIVEHKPQGSYSPRHQSGPSLLPASRTFRSASKHPHRHSQPVPQRAEALGGIDEHGSKGRRGDEAFDNDPTLDPGGWKGRGKTGGEVREHRNIPPSTSESPQQEHPPQQYTPMPTPMNMQQPAPFPGMMPYVNRPRLEKKKWYHRTSRLSSQQSYAPVPAFGTANPMDPAMLNNHALLEHQVIHAGQIQAEGHGQGMPSAYPSHMSTEPGMSQAGKSKRHSWCLFSKGAGRRRADGDTRRHIGGGNGDGGGAEGVRMGKERERAASMAGSASSMREM